VGAETPLRPQRLIDVTATPVGDMPRAVAEHYDDSELSSLIDPAGRSK
jgi:hypothetical protein